LAAKGLVSRRGALSDATLVEADADVRIVTDGRPVTVEREAGVAERRGRLAWRGVVEHGGRMQSTGFCVQRTVAGSWSRLAICQSVVRLRSPDQVSGGLPSNGAAGLVLPLVVAAREHQPFLGPDDLAPALEATSGT
jgi:hypothetical protein